MRVDVIVLILGMALATYLPRALPAVLIGRLRLGSRLEKFLRLIPYTAMTALIFPGIFTVDAAHPVVAAAGGLVAAVLALRKRPLILCVLAAIAVDFAIYLFL